MEAWHNPGEKSSMVVSNPFSCKTKQWLPTPPPTSKTFPLVISIAFCSQSGI